MFRTTFTLFAALLLFGACGDDETTPPINENEVITTMTLTFTPSGGGTPVVAAFDDPDGEGGNAPTIDPITLADGETYTLAVTWTNKLETPPEDVTIEIKDEDDEHQVFLTGDAVRGPASDSSTAVIEHAYDDQDSNGYPLGLSNTITVLGTGTGKLTVTLRHMPLVNDQPVKTATLAADVLSGGITALPGSTDVSSTFDVTVQ